MELETIAFICRQKFRNEPMRTLERIKLKGLAFQSYGGSHADPRAGKGLTKNILPIYISTQSSESLSLILAPFRNMLRYKCS